jgi:beta-phosphoglucomutase
VLEGVIFDMDGVLLDTHPAHLQSWRCVLNELGKDVSDSDLQFVLDGHKRQEILRHFLGDVDESRLAQYGRLKDACFYRFSDSVRALPGVGHFVRTLAADGIAAAVATSAARSRAEDLLEKFDLRCWFSLIVTGDDVACGKPDPTIYKIASVRLGISPDCLLVVEDAVSGVKAARAAGMECLGIADERRAPALLNAGAQLVVPDFEGLSISSLEASFGFASRDKSITTKD